MNTQANFGERYFFKKNPKQGSKFPYLFFDYKANLHLPLTSFTAYLNESYALNTMRSYMYEVIPFFSWYHNENYPENGMFWEQEPEKIRSLISSYLFLKLKCQIKKKRSVNLVYRTKDSSKSVGVFLSALRCFYSSAIHNNLYKFKNPLTGISSEFSERNTPNNQLHFPVMPIISGISEIKVKNRLTDSFFVLANNQWMPQIISDDDFPNKIFNAGKLVGWSLRQILITKLLFETGARVSEVCGLTLGDWVARGAKNEADSFSKGSYGRRVKFLRWSSDTTKLLKTYFDDYRIKFDKSKLKLTDYINLSDNDKINLYDVPIFITEFGTELKQNVYRDLYWKEACKSSNIKASIHQTRHWYVSKIIEEIYSQDLPRERYERKVDELIKYMNWKSGNRTLKAYEHYFDKLEHGYIQDQLHSKLNEQLISDLKSNKELVNVSKNEDPNITQNADDPELDYLWGLGGY